MLKSYFSINLPLFYYAVLKIEVQLVNERGFVDAKIDTDVFFKKTKSGDLSINEESIVYFEICENLFLLLDKELNTQMEKYFNNYIL